MDPQNNKFDPTRKRELSDLERAARMADHRKEIGKKTWMKNLEHNMQDEVKHGAPRSDRRWIGEVARTVGWMALGGAVLYGVFRDNGSDQFTNFSKPKTGITADTTVDTTRIKPRPTP